MTVLESIPPAETGTGSFNLVLRLDPINSFFIFHETEIKSSRSTSNVRALRFRGTSQIKRDSTNLLTEDSVALLFQIRAVDRSRFRKRIGALSAPDLATIESELKKLLGF